jgi:hypothetical protein
MDFAKCTACIAMIPMYYYSEPATLKSLSILSRVGTWSKLIVNTAGSVTDAGETILGSASGLSLRAR